MFSDKDIFDINIDERNLLIPKTCQNELLQAGNSFSSFYSQSPIYSTFANQSSSSADSTSPESHPDIFALFPKLHSEQSNQLTQETPVQHFTNPFITRKRAIVGRKILYSSDSKLSEANNAECDPSPWTTWVDDLLCSSPNRTEEKKVPRAYELFPAEKSYGLRIPSQPTITSQSPVASNISSPTFSTLSGFSNLSHSMNAPTFMERYKTPSQTASFSPPSFSGASSSKTDVIASAKMCCFCRKNGETPMVYMAHTLKEKIGSQNIVTCPILRSHVCPTCGASGDNAHTITYCPVLRSFNRGKRPESTTISLKNTRIKSNGRRRY